MPALVEHIDAIARQQNRDVLFVVFHATGCGPQDAEQTLESGSVDWETLPIRQQIIDWLDEMGMGWRRCGHFANESLMMGYRGQIYIDVPFNRQLPTYQRLESYFEFPDGTMRYSNATFCCCQLHVAMENIAHDAPDFWTRWAENF
jgi:hypothetical protein